MKLSKPHVPHLHLSDLHLREHLHLAELSKLPLLRRLRDPKLRRHLRGLALGILICLMGSSLATNAHVILHAVYSYAGLFIPHFLYDAFAYSVHAFGLMPILEHASPFWKGITA